MEEIRRVFYHELGHFIAHEMNRKFHKGTGTKSIAIFQSEANTELFLGDAKINLSADKRERDVPSKDLLCEYLASSTYGCIFQSYYLHCELTDCFNQNGQDDVAKWVASMRHHNLDHLRGEISVVEKEYFASLRQENQLDEMMALNPDKYLVKEGKGSYTVNIDKLVQDTTDFTDKHRGKYAQLLQLYQQVFDNG